MRLRLHPDPGTGRSWRITLELSNGVELAQDIDDRIDRSSRVVINHDNANDTATEVASELGLVKCGPDEWRN